MAGTRAWPPGDHLADVAGLRAGPGGAHEAQDRIHHQFAYRQSRDQLLRSDEPIAVIVGLGLLSSVPVVSNTILRSALAIRVIDIDSHQKAIKLRLGKRVSAFLLDRVLGREHMKGARNVVTIAATVTCCSCIACSSADCVRGLARLISSAIKSCPKSDQG